MAEFLAALIDDPDVTTGIKTLKANMAFKGSATAKDLDLMQEVFEVEKIDGFFDFSTSFGVVVCMPVYGDDGVTIVSTIGGKIIATINASLDGTADQLAGFESILDDDSGLTDAEIEEILDACPLTIKVTVKAYDDANEVTYTMLDVSSLSDLYTSIESYL